jgi:AcrR family transcriptional regulator
MPRVTDAHRQARRDQIAEAAVQVLMRNGISDTSIAQISAECRLSIGAIYANFENKADLARYIATRLFDWRISELEALADTGSELTPPAMLGILLHSLGEADRPAPSLILQFWSKASVDEELREVLAEQVGRLCASVERALRPWADAQTGGGAGGSGEELARRTAQTCLIMGQGFLANRCLFGWLDADDYLATATAALGAGQILSSHSANV